MRPLRAYQEPLVAGVVADMAAGARETLLAACPGAGKTEMALHVLKRLIEAGTTKRALVLAHAQTNLRHQWRQRIEAAMPGLARLVDVHIPQERRRITGDYDSVVIDEAHQLYEVDGGMVKGVLDAVKPKRVLLLTGSPYVFTARGLKAHALSLQELQDQDGGRYVADLTLLIGQSRYDITQGDWNDKGELRDGLKFKEPRTRDTLDDLLTDLNMDVTGGQSADWGRTAGRLGKTIIACRSVEMADQVGRYFKRRGVGCVVSHQQSDVDSERLQTFKQGGDVHVAAVVFRGSLGFDMPDLRCFVDMTGSKNPIRIFQMVCRVVRPHPGDDQRKLFVKVMPKVFNGEELCAWMSFVMKQAESGFFREWDGFQKENSEIPMVSDRVAARGAQRGSTRPLMTNRMRMWGDGGYFTILNNEKQRALVGVGICRLGLIRGLRNSRELEGLTFGRLTAIERAGISRDGQVVWKCACACGRKHLVKAGNLKSGAVLSCGCLNKTRQGRHGTPEYKILANAKYNCANSSSNQWNIYGGKGIEVCERWRDPKNGFENFLADMGPRPSKEHALRRHDLNGPFSQENCFWGKQDKIIGSGGIVVGGMKKSLAGWSRKTGVPAGTIRARIKRGWPIEKAVGTKVIGPGRRPAGRQVVP